MDSTQLLPTVNFELADGDSHKKADLLSYGTNEEFALNIYDLIIPKIKEEFLFVSYPMMCKFYQYAKKSRFRMHNNWKEV